MGRYAEVKEAIRGRQKRWLISGVSGFIGSHLLEELLLLDQEVIGLDNFSSGSRETLAQVEEIVGERWRYFTLVEGDIEDQPLCSELTQGIDYLLHQAALGSVPRSVRDPISTNNSNISGFLNILTAAKESGVPSFVYASSSSVYGNSPTLPKREQETGSVLSPYALTKKVNEEYAELFASCYGYSTTGLRYFNVFGPRQNPDGDYAAVIPKWAESLREGRPLELYGEEVSRDFCYVKNAVQANLLAALQPANRPSSRLYNVGCGERWTLRQLVETMVELASEFSPGSSNPQLLVAPSRIGDVPHSLAAIDRISQDLGYFPEVGFGEGLKATLSWYWERGVVGA